MVSIGRGRGPLVNRPNNTGRAAGANARLDHIAAAQAQKYTNALAVDGTLVYFWHKSQGTIPCSCSAAPQEGFVAAPVEEFDDDPDADPGYNSTVQLGDGNEESQSRYRPTHTAGRAALDEFLPSTRATVPEKLNLSSAPQPAELDDGFDDLDSALARAEPAAPRDTGTDFNDPFNLFNGKILECPVCLGTGYLDSWQLVNGARVIFDTSGEHGFRATGSTSIDDSRNPTTLTFRNAGDSATWNYTVPLTWTRVLRAAVYNGTARIDPAHYTWTWTHPDGATGDISESGLAVLNQIGGRVAVALVAVQPFEWTHAELCWSYADPQFAQFPEIDQVYEDEFLDWNVTLAVEFPLLLTIKEGDYLCDGRYQKTWKINRLVRKATSNGTVFALSGDVRALHTFERLAEQLNVFGGAQTALRAPALADPTGRAVPSASGRLVVNEW